MNDRPQTEAGAGVRPDASSGNHLEAGAAPHDTDQLVLDFTAPVPAGAYDGAEQAAENTEDHWRNWALREIGIMAANGLEFTSDDLRQVVGEPDIPNRWGGVWLAARRAGLVVPTGEVRPSTTASRHGSLVRVWRAA